MRALERAGLVERTGDPADARAVQLTLTAPGTRVVDRAIRIVADLPERLTRPLGGTTSARRRALMKTLKDLLTAPAPAPPRRRRRPR